MTCVTDGCTGFSCNAQPASHGADDRIDEAGLSSSDWPVEQDPEMFDVSVFRLIIPHILQISLFVSV